MQQTGFLILIAALGGTAVALQGQFMGIMDRLLGTSGSLFINYMTGAVVVSVIMLAQPGSLKAWTEVPIYAFTAGLLGLVIAGSIGYTVPRLGLSTAFTILVTAQFVVALCLSHFGWFGAVQNPVTISQVAGVGSLVLGVWLITGA